MTNKNAIPLFLRLILFMHRKKQAKIRAKSKAKIETRTKTFPRSLAIIVIKKATMPVIIPSQKTNNSLVNLYVDDY